MRLSTRNTPRWIIFSIDMSVALFGLVLAYLIRFDFFYLPLDKELPVLLPALPVYLLVRGAAMYFGKVHKGIVRHAGMQDAKRIFTVSTIGTGIFMLLIPVRYYLLDGYFFLPISIIITEYFLTTSLLIAYRLFVRQIHSEQVKSGREKKRVIVYGAGEMGLITKRTLDQDGIMAYKVVAFIDDDAKKSGKKLDGVNIHHTDKLGSLLESHEIGNVIIAMANADQDNKTRVVDTCLDAGVKVLMVPNFTNWINGTFSTGQLKQARIEDLLGRSEITLENDELRKHVGGKTILITGAAGSIGSEIVRQLTGLGPKNLILFDQAESPLHELQTELLSEYNFTDFDIAVGSVTSSRRVRQVMDKHRPEIVYHAAAYKHVPLMEVNATEAVHTNVIGTKMLADTAIEFGVKEFVMVSTDKAVNPTNVMGASKRAAEIYCQSLNATSDTNFVTTRFGNVLGSSGSVIPLFRKQIENGGPLTITHPEITRYFMTIPEACQLVLEAAAMGKGGEIFIFDMGKSIKIIDLAKKMIMLSGLELDRDIRIEVTGLRPGEKLYEELLANEENTIKTHHPKIMIAKVREYSKEEITTAIAELVESLAIGDETGLVRKLKEIVPEFKSNNSVFEKLD